MTEKEVIEQYSTEGLRRNKLSRSAKKDQLNGLKVPVDERDKILDELYGPETE